LRVLWFNLATDADDTNLGFTSRWIEAVARRVERVCVVTMRQGRVELPPNVRVLSLGRERGYSEARRGARFYAILLDLLRTESPDVCFSHMTPIFSIMAAPVLRLWNVPIVTWFAHRSVHWKVKLAHVVSARMTTSLARTYGYRRDKLRIIGQGIDTRHFSPDNGKIEDPPVILCAGRLSPVKDHETFVRALASLRGRVARPFRGVILGDSPQGQEEYAQWLRRLIRQTATEDLVTIQPGVPMESLRRWYCGATVHVNLTPPGSGDKVVFEGMSCGRPGVVANDDFREALGSHAERLLFPPRDTEALAGRLAWLLSRSDDELGAMGADLGAEVRARHSLDALADRIVGVLTEVV
jgi:glycosyltransferase involved in cell wall biosynthesis